MELAKCPVCLDLLAKPFVLGCGHSFCELCALESVNVNDRCPVCRQPTRGHCAPNVDLDKLIRGLLLPLMEPETAKMYEARCEEQKKRIKTKNGLRCMIWTHLEENRPRAVLLEEVVHRCKVVYGEDENVLREIRAIFNREILGNECSVFNATETPKGVALSFKDAFQATRAT